MIIISRFFLSSFSLIFSFFHDMFILTFHRISNHVPIRGAAFSIFVSCIFFASSFFFFLSCGSIWRFSVTHHYQKTSRGKAMITSAASSSFFILTFIHLLSALFLVIYPRTMHGLLHTWRMWVSGARSVGFPSTVHHLLFLSTSFFLLLDVICFAIPLAIPSICISFVLLELYLHVFCLFGMGFGYQVIGTG